MKHNNNEYCGYVAIIGKPNVGKSTLMNHLIGQKISITSKKAQTTQQRIYGIYTEGKYQIIFIDTPGFQKVHNNPLNNKLNQNAIKTLSQVDVIVYVIEGNRYNLADQKILQYLPPIKPCILVINKMDKVKNKDDIEDLIGNIYDVNKFRSYEVISAKHGFRISHLIEKIEQLLPLSQHIYPEDMITDKSSRFLAKEMIREKIYRYLGQEVPYALNVEIESFEESETLYRIYALILVNKKSQKGIVIGEKGIKLKKISTEARIDMEKLFQTKVFLKIWVKVKTGWANDIQFLKELDMM